MDDFGALTIWVKADAEIILTRLCRTGSN